MNQEIQNLILQLEKKDAIFKNKKLLDALYVPEKIIGREKQKMELLKFLIGYKDQNYVVPFISIYGRSGSGKSVITKYVCDNLDGISYAIVNIRQARTIFGATNVILSGLGQQSVRSAQGMHYAIESIGSAIEAMLQKDGKRCFVLVLDEMDVLFYDQRNRPSDFLYRLVTLEERMRQKGLMLCIIGIMNNGLAEYELDDRVRSRIGSSEIFFEPYIENRILDILKERASEAFASPIDSSILEYCAEISSTEHGDARRAIDLLRVAAEIAGEQNEPLSKNHVNLAKEELQKDRVLSILSNGSYHFRVICLALAQLTYAQKKDWHSTSTIYAYYAGLVKNVKPLGERQVSNILTEIKNSGLVVSSTASHGRQGYGTQFKMTVTPNVMGNGVSPEWWKSIVLEEIEMQKFRASYMQRKKSGGFGEYLLQQMQQLDDETDALEEEIAKYSSSGKIDDDK